MATRDSIQIYLNSKSANKYLISNSTTECVWFLPNIEIPKRAKLFMSIQNVVIPYSFFNCDTYNNKFVYSVGAGANIVLYIPEGNYTVISLKDYLKSVMTGFTITYVSSSNKLLFTHPSQEFTLHKESLCYELLGFTDGVDYISTSHSLTSVITCNLFSIRMIYIESENILCSNINASTPNNASIICGIPVNSGSYGVITYENNGMTRFIVDHIDNWSELKLRLTDQDGASLDLNGCHWSVTLQIDIV